MIHLVRPCESGGGEVVADSIISQFVINQSWHLAPLLPSLLFLFFFSSNSPLAIKLLLSWPAGVLSCGKISDRKR